jgi:hypothetical protein
MTPKNDVVQDLQANYNDGFAKFRKKERSLHLSRQKRLLRRDTNPVFQDPSRNLEIVLDVPSQPLEGLAAQKSTQTTGLGQSSQCVLPYPAPLHSTIQSHQQRNAPCWQITRGNKRAPALRFVAGNRAVGESFHTDPLASRRNSDMEAGQIP